MADLVTELRQRFENAGEDGDVESVWLRDAANEIGRLRIEFYAW